MMMETVKIVTGEKGSVLGGSIINHHQALKRCMEQIAQSVRAILHLLHDHGLPLQSWRLKVSSAHPTAYFIHACRHSTHVHPSSARFCCLGITFLLCLTFRLWLSFDGHSQQGHRLVELRTVMGFGEEVALLFFRFLLQESDGTFCVVGGKSVKDVMEHTQTDPVCPWQMA